MPVLMRVWTFIWVLYSHKRMRKEEEKKFTTKAGIIPHEMNLH
jgi:hypothetical protein